MVSAKLRSDLREKSGMAGGFNGMIHGMLQCDLQFFLSQTVAEFFLSKKLLTTARSTG
jgi:hypothetical protein